MRYPKPSVKKEVTHIYKVPKGEFLMRIGIGNAYNGLKYEIDDYADDKNILVSITVPALNKNGNYTKVMPKP